MLVLPSAVEVDGHDGRAGAGVGRAPDGRPFDVVARERRRRQHRVAEDTRWRLLARRRGRRRRGGPQRSSPSLSGRPIARLEVVDRKRLAVAIAAAAAGAEDEQQSGEDHLHVP